MVYLRKKWGDHDEAYTTTLLWQPLDQCPITALQVNLKAVYLIGNTSCVIHKKTWQWTITVFYWLFI